MGSLRLSWLAPTVCSALLGCAPGRGTIGAMLGQRADGLLFVRETPEKLAAHEAGLRPGDQVLLIDGRDVRHLSAQRVHEVLSGPPGTKVKLTVIRGDDVVRTTVERRPVPALPSRPENSG